MIKKYEVRGTKYEEFATYPSQLLFQQGSIRGAYGKHTGCLSKAWRKHKQSMERAWSGQLKIKDERLLNNW